MRTETTEARAKINLYLDVVGRRADGYHLIDGVMQSVTLCDLVSVAFGPAEQTEITLTAAGNDRMPTDGTNLAINYIINVTESQLPQPQGNPLDVNGDGDVTAADITLIYNHLLGN